MSLVTVFSAKGAPGATTTAMLLASLWPRPSILVDADPAGGDVALRLPGADGRALDRERGLLSLLPAVRRGLLPEMVAQHAQEALGGQQVVAGLPGPEQAHAVAPLWPALATAFASVSDADVIVDAGQLHPRAPHLALAESSDLVVCVYRLTAWSAFHTRHRLESLAERLGDPVGSRRTGVVAVAPPHAGHDVEVATSSITRDLEWVAALGALALDPKAVVMFEGGDVHRPERTLLARSGSTLASRLFDEVRRAEPLPSLVTGTGAHAPEDEVPAERGKRRRGKRVRRPREAAGRST